VFGETIMILFGHPLIPSEKFYRIDSIDAISHTPSNAIVVFPFNPSYLPLIEHLRTNHVRFALEIATIDEAVIGENLRANYLIVRPEAGEAIQKVAEHYLFDAKILGYCADESHLESLIALRLDGAIFPLALV
jgi:hypothetical protein